MPIFLLWNALALPHVKGLKRLLNDLGVAGALIQGWLRKRTGEAERIERATSGFPIFRFYNEAVTARIDSLQRFAISSERHPGFGASMRAIGDAWRIDRVFANRVREARLIGRLMDVVVGITQSALDSIVRWENPRAELFNPANARFSDLFGLGALTFRALGSGRNTLEAAGRRIHAALNRPRAATTASGTTAGDITAEGSGGAAVAAGVPLAMRLDEFVRYLAAGLLVVPAVCALVADLGRDLLLWLRVQLIEQLFSVEQRVFDFRQGLLAGIWNGLRAFSATAVEFLLIARDYALGHIRHWARFGVAYLDSITTGVVAFTDQLGTFWNGVHGLVMAMMSLTDRVMSIEIGNVIHHLLKVIANTNDLIGFWFNLDLQPDVEYEPPAWFPLTIADLVLNEGNGPLARDHLARALHALATTVENFTGSGFVLDQVRERAGIDVRALIGGVRGLLRALNTTPQQAQAQPVLVFSEADEPNLVVEIIHPLRTGFSRAVTDLMNGARLGIEGVTVGLLQLLDGTAAQFAAAATNAARLGSLGHYREIVAGSEALVARAFPTGPAAAPTGFEGIARAFSLWLVGAFDSIGAIMGRYLGFVLDEWQRHLADNADTPVEVTPTSPLILLERARLGRVHLPELRIIAGGRPTDRELATLVAQRFRAAVSDAYVAGERSLGGLREAALPAAA